MMTTQQKVIKDKVPASAFDKLRKPIKEAYADLDKIDGQLAEVNAGTGPVKAGQAGLEGSYLDNPSPENLGKLAEGLLPKEIIVLKFSALRRVFKAERKQTMGALTVLAKTVATIAEPYATEWLKKIEKAERALSSEVAVEYSPSGAAKALSGAAQGFRDLSNWSDGQSMAIAQIDHLLRVVI